jgi:NAD(P)-dependent dehydrogenase (short-subunit alcohol dehydrogenase family)
VGDFPLERFDEALVAQREGSYDKVGAGGIGLASARLLAEAGATVWIGDLDPEAGEAAAASIAARFVPLDVSSTESVDAAVDTVLATDGRLDIGVNCAGIRHLGALAEDLTDEEWATVMDINASGVFRSCRAEGRAMLAAGSGAIVNIASMSGHVVNRPQSQTTYNASKSAVLMLTKSLAVEWAARGVRVNSVSPGYVETALTARSRAMPERLDEWLHRTPMGRIGQPDEIAGAVLYLVSDASSFVTGSDLLVDGGYTSV